MSRKLVRHAIADWVTAAQIPGLDKVWPGKVPEIPWSNYGSGSYLCQAYVLIGRRRSGRIALGGPTSGQKCVTSSAVIIVWFRSTDPDWLDAQDAMDDLTLAIIEQLQAGGRTLGRGDAISEAGEYEAGISQVDDEPEALDGGIMQAVCQIMFEVDEVITA